MTTALRVGSASHPGRVRTINEDSQLISSRIPLYAVADGMGGHQGGEVASAIAVHTLDEAVTEPTLEALVAGVELANRQIRNQASSDPALRGMGTTLCAIVLLEGDEGVEEEIGWVNVGDSRIYLFRDDELIQLSQDHNLVAEMQREGQITDDQAAVHPQRNIITRALGIDSRVQVDSSTVLPYTGDRFLLCSDGLSDELNVDQIAATMRRLADPGDVADDLVRQANEHGGRDNVTCVVVDVTDDGDRAGAASAALADEPRTTEWTAPPADEPAADGSDDDREFAPRSDDLYRDLDEARGRHVTWRVVTFVVAFLVILAVAVGAVGWAAKRTYFVGFSGKNVAIYQGRPGGLLWIDPKLEDVSSLRRGDLTDAQREDVSGNRRFSSLSDARSFTDNLESSAADRTTTTTTTSPKTSTTSTSRPTTTPTTR
ncbi:MAG: Stp1/IreP family PP2C-type Ser/Thr phosphatase [Acidimicrobiia bacterium]|nr:Stp1/IreP family PP2C-type Ser/Thr phosphatase [Acidimicrobiia bacterium]